jgi:hypothetical protein
MTSKADWKLQAFFAMMLPLFGLQICGITSVDDCKLAAGLGADLIGMIMWPNAKRSVSDAVAKDICSCALCPENGVAIWHHDRDFAGHCKLASYR